MEDQGTLTRVVYSANDLRDPPALVRDVIDQNVLAKAVGGGVEGTALVDLGELVHELFQVVVAVQHEGVDDDALLRAALHLAQRLAESARAGRVLEEEAAALFHVGGR